MQGGWMFVKDIRSQVIAFRFWKAFFLHILDLFKNINRV